MTKLVTLDFETFYGDDYTLSKLTTEAYVRHPRFEAIMVGIKVDNAPPYTVVGGHLKEELHRLELHKHAVLCHHSHFDGLILNQYYGIRPKIWFDTLPMGRAEIGSHASKGMSLGSMAEHLGIGRKGHEVVAAKNKHLGDFEAWELEAYRGYCQNDCELTYKIFMRLLPKFAKSELQLIDLTTRMFTEPVLELDTDLLIEYKDAVLRNKEHLMLRAGVDRDELMSNNKFADVLRRYGIDPPMKDSPTAKLPDGTPKRTYAFAKTDQAMQDLLESDNETISVLAEARLGVKTTIAETRAQRFIDMSTNGATCVYLKYWGAEQTGRHSGGDKLNFQNLGRKVRLADHYLAPGIRMFGPKGRTRITDVGITQLATEAGVFKQAKCHHIGLRDSVLAPEGHSIVVGDSSNIEARVLCWIAGQEDVLDTYRDGGDPYCDLASSIYSKVVTKKDETERQLGKVGVLGLGFGMGKAKFFDTATGPMWGIDIEKELTDRAVDVFRGKYDRVAAFWKYLNDYVIPAMASGKHIYADPLQKITTVKDGLLLPNGRILRYPNLRQRKNPDPDSPFKLEWVFDVREDTKITPTRLYGGKLCENIVQALARIVVLDQSVAISKLYKVALLVHDEVVACVRDELAEACQKFMLQVMREVPLWAEGLPLNAETGIGKVYSLAK